MAYLVLAFKTTSSTPPIIDNGKIYIWLYGTTRYVWQSLIEDASTGKILACFLLAVISLMGVGWETPGSLATSMGIKSPDYSKAQRSTQKITEALRDIRGKSISNRDEVKNFLELVQELQTDIKNNREIEPSWAKIKVNNAYDELGKLIEQIQKEFLDNQQNVKDFPAACKYQNESQYSDFVTAMRNLSSIWIEWKYQK
jgi:hypothetical protein